MTYRVVLVQDVHPTACRAWGLASILVSKRRGREDGGPLVSGGCVRDDQRSSGSIGPGFADGGLYEAAGGVKEYKLWPEALALCAV